MGRGIASFISEPRRPVSGNWKEGIVAAKQGGLCRRDSLLKSQLLSKSVMTKTLGRGNQKDAKKQKVKSGKKTTQPNQHQRGENQVTNNKVGACQKEKIQHIGRHKTARSLVNTGKQVLNHAVRRTINRTFIIPSIWWDYRLVGGWAGLRRCKGGPWRAAAGRCEGPGHHL